MGPAKPFAVLAVLVVAVVSAAGVAMSQQGDQPFDKTLGANLPLLVPSSVPVAFVNGVEIQKSQLDAARIVASRGGGSGTDVLEQLIDFELLRQAGVRMGLEPTAKEVEAAITKTRETLPPAAEEEALAYAKRLGHALTADEYWASPRYRDAYRSSITAHRALEALSAPDQGQASRRTTDSVVAELRRGASIQVVAH